MFSQHKSAAGEFNADSIRYAQCWEDADVLLRGLEIKPGDVCLSIASGGENTLSMLVANPAKVVAIDLNQAQLACLELKMAGFRCLTHFELLLLIGSVDSSEEYARLHSGASVQEPTVPLRARNARQSRELVKQQRLALYRRCRKYLSTRSRAFWDVRKAFIAGGIGAAGRFENYFEVFRKVILPLVHSSKVVSELLAPKSLEAQEVFYSRRWNTLAWRLLFRGFFSRQVMSALGRSRYQFQYVDQPVAERILARTAYALKHISTSSNPYLHWIVTGKHGTALPHALRKENFDIIKRNVDRIELRCCSIEQALVGGEGFDRLNLSDVFEYMDAAEYERHLRLIVESSKPRARMVYWNMLAVRRSTQIAASEERRGAGLKTLDQLSSDLFNQDKAFFYSGIVVEELEQCSVTSALSS